MGRVADAKCTVLCSLCATGSHLALFQIWHSSDARVQAPVVDSKCGTNVYDQVRIGFSSFCVECALKTDTAEKESLELATIFKSIGLYARQSVPRVVSLK